MQQPKPARKIVSRSPHRSVGAMRALGTDLEGESHNELNAYVLVSNCHDVISIGSQPFTTFYGGADGLDHQYTPDAQLLLSNRITAILEVKAAEFVLCHDEVQRLAVLKRELTNATTRFDVITDLSIYRRPRLDNARLLRQYREPFDVDESDVRAARDLLGKHHGHLPIKVLADLSCGLSSKAILTMIANRHLAIDWDTPLTEASNVALAGPKQDALQEEAGVEERRPLLVAGFVSQEGQTLACNDPQLLLVERSHAIPAWFALSLGGIFVTYHHCHPLP